MKSVNIWTASDETLQSLPIGTPVCTTNGQQGVWGGYRGKQIGKSERRTQVVYWGREVAHALAMGYIPYVDPDQYLELLQIAYPVK